MPVSFQYYIITNHKDSLMEQEQSLRLMTHANICLNSLFICLLCKVKQMLSEPFLLMQTSSGKNNEQLKKTHAEETRGLEDTIMALVSTPI